MIVTAAMAASENTSLEPMERALLERWAKLTFRASIRLVKIWISYKKIIINECKGCPLNYVYTKNDDIPESLFK